MLRTLANLYISTGHAQTACRAGKGRLVQPSGYYACSVECPQHVSVLCIARMNFEYNRAKLLRKTVKAK